MSRRRPAPKRRSKQDQKALRRRRLGAGLVVSIVLVGFLLVGVFPTRTWLDQRSETAVAEERLARIRAEQADYEERVDELNTPEEVERQARETFGFVRPGETAYRVLPGGVDPVDLPDGWPFSGAEDWLNR